MLISMRDPFRPVEGTKRVGVSPAESVEHWRCKVVPKIARSTGGFKDLLSMDPPFRKLATMVEPDGDRIRASPPDMRPDGRRILCCDETDDLAVSPREQLGHEARAEPPSSMDPFHLQIIEPLDEPGLIDVGRRGSAARLVSLPRQQTEISTNEVDREAKHIPVDMRSDGANPPAGGLGRTSSSRARSTRNSGANYLGAVVGIDMSTVLLAHHLAARPK
jgi:hypothetical protein